jgi:hypothetical protein
MRAHKMWNRELALAKKVGNGDVQAWGRMVDLNYSSIFRYLKFLSGSDESAADPRVNDNPFLSPTFWDSLPHKPVT